jgi:hypothetical protein
MSPDADQLALKAGTAVKSLAILSPEQRRSPIADAIACEFNTFRGLVVAARPDIESSLPAKLSRTTGADGSESHEANYRDLESFYAQIACILIAG